jgi:folate-binding protein YgfZ
VEAQGSPVPAPTAIPDDVLGPRDVVVVEGPDALTYLHSQVSQDLRRLEVGDAVWTFLLEPAGKVSGLARVTRTADERFELDTDAGYGAGLLARIDRFMIRVKVTASLVPAAEHGPARDEAARVRLGWPALGIEIVPGETLPAATGLAPLAVSFTKGCYPGQELVERMDSRGAEAPRTLRRLTVAEGTSVGDPVFDGDEVVGEVTSVSGTSALGWVKRGSEIGQPLDVASLSAQRLA